MLEIFKFCSEVLAAIVKKWQAIEIGGFRPFWYFIGLGLLTIFGFFLRGLLFSGAGGEGISKLGKLSNSKKIVVVK